MFNLGKPISTLAICRFVIHACSSNLFSADVTCISSEEISKCRVCVWGGGGEYCWANIQSCLIFIFFVHPSFICTNDWCDWCGLDYVTDITGLHISDGFLVSMKIPQAALAFVIFKENAFVRIYSAQQSSDEMDM